MDSRPSRLAIFFHVVLIVGPILGLFVYWFGVADRYRIFLYFHDMGPIYLDTSPFSRVTRSRYWMAGLVADGVVLLIHTGVSRFALSLLGRRLRILDLIPGSGPIWVGALLPLLVGILLITMTLNQPTLPLRDATIVTVVTLAGLWVALLTSDYLIQNPPQILWLTLDGLGMAAILLGLGRMELAQRWLAGGSVLWLLLSPAMVGSGILWLLLMKRINSQPYIPRRTPGQLILAGVCVTYLLLPLAHHILGSDGYFYITDSDNFFASQLWIQLSTWAMTGLIAHQVAR